MFQFADKIYLFLLLLLPLLVAGFIFSNIHKRKQVEQLGDLYAMKSLMPELSLKRWYLKFWLLFAAITLLILIIARPQWGEKVEETNVEKQGIELVIAIDVSRSMLAADVAPNRLKAAKRMMTSIINTRKNDKIALVVFAGEAYIQMPITSDGNAAKMFLDEINTQMVASQGTDLAKALQTSIHCFSGDEDIDKAVVLITDGEDHQQQAVEMANEAIKHHIQVNVIGIGSEEGSTVPTSETNPTPKTDSEGKIVVSRFNEELCRQIAEAGKGLFVRADNTNNAVKNLQAELKNLQTKKISGQIVSRYSESFYILAWCVLAILIAEICIFDKKNRIFRNVKLFKR